MFLSALVLGLLGSFHCIGMCGPIALVLPVHTENPLRKFLKICSYHLGRMFAYGSIGLVFGFLGKGLFLSGFQQRLSILIGIFMIAYILIPSKLLNKFKITTPIFNFIGIIKSSLAKQLKNKSSKSLAILGFLNGFLPCGMVYMALAGAIATATPYKGFLYMFIYGLGTIPLLTLLIYSKNIFSINTRNKIQKAIPVFVVVIGILFILRGMGIGIPYVSPVDATLQIQNNASTCAPIDK